MKSFMKHFDKLEEYLMLVIFPLMVILVFVSTMVRYFQLGSMAWAEEGSRYLMIILVLLGISYGFRHDVHLGMSFLVDRVSGKTGQLIVKWVRIALILLFGGLMINSTWALIQNQMQFTQRSASLGIPMVNLYIIMLIGYILMVIRTIQSGFVKRDDPEDEEVPSI